MGFDGGREKGKRMPRSHSSLNSGANTSADSYEYALAA